MSHRKHILDGLLIIVMLSSLTIMGIMATHFYTLQNGKPFKNLQVETVQPVYTDSKEIIWEGTFDRPIDCKLLHFHLILTNTQTEDMIKLTKLHLTRSPKNKSEEAGLSIPINFAMRTPDTLYEGIWNSTFTAKYFCTKGLFSSLKYSSIMMDSFTVKDKKNH